MLELAASVASPENCAVKLCGPKASGAPRVEAFSASVAVLGEPVVRLIAPGPSRLPPSKKLTVPLAVGEETVAVSVTVWPTGAEDAGEATSVVVVDGATVRV